MRIDRFKLYHVYLSAARKAASLILKVTHTTGKTTCMAGPLVSAFLACSHYKVIYSTVACGH